MTETQATYNVEAVGVEIDVNRQELMKRWEINSVNTIKTWCDIVGIPRTTKVFTPEQVAKLEHLKFHVQEQGVSYDDYRKLIGNDAPAVDVNETHGRYQATSQDEATQGSQVSKIIEKRYQGTINAMAKPVARTFWESLDAAVLREVAVIAATEQVPTRIEQNVLPAFVEKDLQAWLLPPASEEVGC